MQKFQHVEEGTKTKIKQYRQGNRPKSNTITTLTTVDKLMARYTLILLLLLSPTCLADERECLALNIYHEARDQPLAGQIAVAYVTYNRVLSPYFKNTFCEVVYRTGQFSWTLNDPGVHEPEAYKDGLLLAATFLLTKDYIQDPTKGSLFYHAYYVTPCWFPDAEYKGSIGDHLFYNVRRAGTSCWRKT